MHSHAPGRLRAKTNLFKTQLAPSRRLITYVNVCYELHTSYRNSPCFGIFHFLAKSRHVWDGNDTIRPARKRAKKRHSFQNKCLKTNGAHCSSICMHSPAGFEHGQASDKTRRLLRTFVYNSYAK